jgi:hypothetical protein
MNHLEAQSHIMPFINGQIPPDKQEEFVMHMNNCPKCHEELEVYYILLNGMKQLEGNEKLSTNLSKDLDVKLSKLYKGAKGRRNIKFSAFGFLMAGVILVAAILYAACITGVYSYEQDAKRSVQGEYYFCERLSDKILQPEKDRVSLGESYIVVEEITDFERIRDYNNLRDQLYNILDIGEELLYEAPAD